MAEVPLIIESSRGGQRVAPVSAFTPFGGLRLRHHLMGRFYEISRPHHALAARMSDAADIFAGLPRKHFAAILADPPWRFSVWGRRSSRDPERHYPTHETENIATLPVGDLAADDSCLFMWFSWPMLPDALALITAWGFEFKTCAFCWVKGNGSQIQMFDDTVKADMTLGYWTRANSEACLLATRGKPKRLHADVRQGIIEPRREHSRKPDCVYQRIERLVAGPYLELFARNKRENWTSWGNQVGKFREVA